MINVLTFTLLGLCKQIKNQSGMESNEEESFSSHPQIVLINTFCEITASQSKSEAVFFLESHNFDLDSAVSTFFETGASLPDAAVHVPTSPMRSRSQNSPSEDSSPLRFRSPSPPPDTRSYNLRSAANPKTAGSASSGHTRRITDRIRTLGDLSRVSKDEDSDSDPDFDPQEYYTGGEKSGMLVQDPSRASIVDKIFDQASQQGAMQGSTEHLLPPSSSFVGTARLLSGESSSTPHVPEVVTHDIIFWRNGFTVDDGPLRRFEDPENASFLENIKRSECPKELSPADRKTEVHVNVTRRDENYQRPGKHHLPFEGAGRTLGSTRELVAPTEPTTTTALASAPSPSLGLVVDETQPSSSIQLRLADGTRMIARFNNYNTIRDVRRFIDASRFNGPANYQLQIMGFPPKQLTDLDQTVDQAGIANSVVIQKL